jgi:hypothetical protein
MQTVTTIGLDIAKSVFQVHGVDAEGKVVLRRTCGRPPETRCTPELVPKQGANPPANKPKSSLVVPDTGKVLGYSPKPPEFRRPTSLVAERIDSGRVRVLDGDTIRLDRAKPDVRLVGCNAPETRRAKCEAERQLGGQATRRLRDLVQDGTAWTSRMSPAHADLAPKARPRATTVAGAVC